MITPWHPVSHDPAVVSALETEMHGRCLHVEHRRDERQWRWAVRSRRGTEIASGVAGDAHAAERAAEDETCKVHVPVGDATGWWLDR